MMRHNFVRRRALLALISACATVAGCAQLIQPNISTEPAQLRAGQYALDPDHAVVLFKVNHLGYSKFVGRFNSLDAALDFDPENPEAARLEVVIRTASIDVNDADFEDTLTGSGWFNSQAFPDATFESRSIELTGDNTGRIHGAFTMLGVTRPLTLNVIFNGGARNLLTQRFTVGFEGSARLRRSEYGMESLIPAIGDEIELEIHVEFQRQ